MSRAVKGPGLRPKFAALGAENRCCERKTGGARKRPWHQIWRRLARGGRGNFYSASSQLSWAKPHPARLLFQWRQHTPGCIPWALCWSYCSERGTRRETSGSTPTCRGMGGFGEVAALGAILSMAGGAFRAQRKGAECTAHATQTLLRLDLRGGRSFDCRKLSAEQQQPIGVCRAAEP